MRQFYVGRFAPVSRRRRHLAEATVKIHVSAILKALRVTSRTQAVIRCTQLGLVPPDPGGAPQAHSLGGAGSGTAS